MIDVVTFDVETTTLNRGNPFTASNKMISYSIKELGGDVRFSYYTDIDFITALRSVSEARLLVGFNIKFDLHWANRYGVQPNPRARVWDCQIAEFIITGQKGAYPSLNDCAEKYGLGRKDDKIAQYWAIGVDTDDIPPDELRVYGNLDVDLTYQIYLKQYEVMTEKQRKLCLVMGLDLLVLREMEANGVRFNSGLCAEKEKDVGERLRVVEEELLAFAPDPRINLGSGQQLSALLYGGAYEVEWVESEETKVYKSGIKKGQEYIKQHKESKVLTCEPLFTPLRKTEYARKYTVGLAEYTAYQTNEDVLKQLRATSKKQKRIIELLLLRAEYAKLMDTYYGALPVLLETMEWGDTIYGQYNQCVAATGRLSSSRPNMQNFSGEVDELLVTRYDD